MKRNRIRLTESQLKNMIAESVKNICEGWRFNSPREEWVDSFGEEYVQRLESPVGELLTDAEKELDSVINFGKDYEGVSLNPIGELSCYYCHGDYSDKEVLRELISILSNYDLICPNKDGSIDVKNSNHVELAKRINQLIGSRISESQLKRMVNETVSKEMIDASIKELANLCNLCVTLREHASIMSAFIGENYSAEAKELISISKDAESLRDRLAQIYQTLKDDNTPHYGTYGVNKDEQHDYSGLPGWGE